MHYTYYGQKAEPDQRQKYKSHGHFNRANYRFMTDKQFREFLLEIKAKR